MRKLQLVMPAWGESSVDQAQDLSLAGQFSQGWGGWTFSSAMTCRNNLTATDNLPA